VLIYVIVPYIAYMLIGLGYITYVVEDVDDVTDLSIVLRAVELIMRSWQVIFIFYFASIAFVQWYSTGIKQFFSIFYIMDLI
jgi:hypothetical protein